MKNNYICQNKKKLARRVALFYTFANLSAFMLKEDSWILQVLLPSIFCVSKHKTLLYIRERMTVTNANTALVLL